MQQFDFTVKHIKGQENVLADALSRLNVNVLVAGNVMPRVD